KSSDNSAKVKIEKKDCIKNKIRDNHENNHKSIFFVGIFCARKCSSCTRQSIFTRSKIDIRQCKNMECRRRFYPKITPCKCRMGKSLWNSLCKSRGISE